MKQQFTNNAIGYLNSSITALSSSIVLGNGEGANFPTLTNNDWFMATLYDGSNTVEIVKCTARSSDTLTVTRAQEGTSASAFSAGATLSLNITKAGLDRFIQTSSSGLARRYVVEGRLTLTSGTPITTTDVTAATTLYFTPYQGNGIALYDGARWDIYNISELSIAVPSTTNQMYDVWIDYNSGTPVLALTAWTNDTTRATALTTQDGVYVKTGDTGKRYVGSFRTTGVSGQTESSNAKQYVWNYYNRVDRYLRVVDTTASWSYSSSTVRQMRGTATNQLDFVIGVEEDSVACSFHASLSSPSTSAVASIGIGLDSTSASSTTNSYSSLFNTTGSGNKDFMFAQYQGYPGIGRHVLVPLEAGPGSGTINWYGYTTLMTTGQGAAIFGTIKG